MSWKESLKSYLTFSKRDRIALFTIVGLILLLYFLPRFFGKKSEPVAIKEDAGLTKAVDTLQRRAERQSFYRNNYEDRPSRYQYETSESSGFSPKGELFTFDPNTLSIEGWKRLGLNDRTVRTINNYRSKGGKFYKPEDIKKIWGMPEGFYERVANYVQITSVQKRTFTNDYPREYNRPTYERRERRIDVVNVNEDDTTAFIALPGIGSRLAFRITNFRDKLGGFYSVDQIGETYGLPDSTFQKIKPYLNVNAAAVRKININTATKDDLKAHPYIRWNLANAIVEYRNQHGGSYKSLEELKNIVLMDETTFDKVAPYLTL